LLADHKFKLIISQKILYAGSATFYCATRNVATSVYLSLSAIIVVSAVGSIPCVWYWLYICHRQRQQQFSW